MSPDKKKWWFFGSDEEVNDHSTHRYDKAEARCRDEKTHDNDNHPSFWSHLRKKAESDEELRDFQNLDD